MTQDIQVSCLVNRYWDLETKDWTGDIVNGTLIGLSTQSETYSGEIIPVGIVLLDNDNTFQCVPMEFITKTN